MEKIKLTKITHYEKDRDNKPLLTKNNKPYVRCLIQDDKGRKMSGFGSAETQKWSEGNEVSLEIEQRGQYLNFKLPDQRVSREEFDIMKKKVKFLDDEVESLHKEIETLKLGEEVEKIEDEGVDLGDPPEELETI